MKSERQEKMEVELLKLASNFIARESNKTALITATRCDLSPDFKNGTIYITVLPEDKERAGLEFLKRHLHELRDYIKKNMDMRVIPFFQVEIDMGEKNRQRIDEIGREV